MGLTLKISPEIRELLSVRVPQELFLHEVTPDDAHDGDTLTHVTVGLPFIDALVLVTGQSVRFCRSNDGPYDAPELRDPGGREARDALREIVASASQISVRAFRREKYGRIYGAPFAHYADKSLQPLDIVERMISLGHLKK